MRQPGGSCPAALSLDRPRPYPGLPQAVPGSPGAVPGRDVPDGASLAGALP